MPVQFTYSQCKRIVKEGLILRNALEQINEEPEWLKSLGGIDSGDKIVSINHGGCASGAFMPAVTYHTALECMNEFDVEICDFIEDHYGELPAPPLNSCWALMASFFVSTAVELWCSQFGFLSEEG